MAKSAKNSTKAIKEPTMIVRPVSRLGGLDSIHIALLIIVALLIAIVLVLSFSRPIIVKNITNVSTLTCVYGSVNGTCVTPIHNESQAMLIAQKTLATYAFVTNSSLDLIPYASNVSRMSLTYAPTSGEWLVTVPVRITNESFNIYFTINDTTGVTSSASQQIPIPKVPLNFTNNYVVSTGVIRLTKGTPCSVANSVTINWFVDPYGPDGVAGLLNYTALQSRFGSNLNSSVDILFGQYSQYYESQYGVENGEALGNYVLCASEQSGQFSQFVRILNNAYTNSYMSPNALNTVAQQAGLNTSALDTCIVGANKITSAQAYLANFYGVTFSPAAVTNCDYLSLPDTAQDAVCYTDKALC